MRVFPFDRSPHRSSWYVEINCFQLKGRERKRKILAACDRVNCCRDIARFNARLVDLFAPLRQSRKVFFRRWLRLMYISVLFWNFSDFFSWMRVYFKYFFYFSFFCNKSSCKSFLRNKSFLRKRKYYVFYNDFVEISFGITKRLSWDCNEEWENFRSIYRSLHKGELLSIIVSHSYVSIIYITNRYQSV